MDFSAHDRSLLSHTSWLTSARESSAARKPAPLRACAATARVWSTQESRRALTEPSSTANATVNWLAIVALVIGAVSIFFNPYLLSSVVAIVLGIVALINARRSGNPRAYELVAILGIVAGAIGAVLVIVGNTISASL